VTPCVEVQSDLSASAVRATVRCELLPEGYRRKVPIERSKRIHDVCSYGLTLYLLLHTDATVLYPVQITVLYIR